MRSSRGVPAGVTVISPGLLALVQDGGRGGWAHLGVSGSGAADGPAMRLGNRLLGNDETAPVIEVTNGGFAFRCERTVVFVVTGAPVEVRVGQRRFWSHSVVAAAAGDPVQLGTPDAGLRSYVAVRGGFAVEASLGSCSTDLLSGLGPRPLRSGDRLALGERGGALPFGDLLVAPPPMPRPDADLVLPIRLGPRTDWFRPQAVSTLLGRRFVVTPESDRVGVRLSGPPLPRRCSSELTSEGVVQGSLQVPPGGRMTLFGPDHPVTGGYPVIAVVRARGLATVAQLRPGQGVRFSLG